MRAQVLDTTVLIQLLRDPDRDAAFQRLIESGQAWLPAVVAAELYAGSRSQREGAVIDRVVAAMGRIQRLLVPTAEDWVRAGRLIARQIRLRGPLRPRDHPADVLILVSAARLSGAVVTANVRHFEAWARLAAGAGMDVTVTPS